MLVLFIISLAVFLGFAGTVMYRYGIPESLSATYYLMGSRGWIFQAMLLCVAVSLYPLWFTVCSEALVFFPFFGCTSLLFVAAAPCFRIPLEGMVHYGFAVVCCICALGWQVVEGLWDVSLWFAFLGGMLCMRYRTQWCWWLECALVLSLFANIFRVLQ